MGLRPVIAIANRALIGAALVLAIATGAAASPDLTLKPGRLVGALTPYRVHRGDHLVDIAVRFTVHPIRIYKPNMALIKSGGLQYGRTLMVDQRRIDPRFPSDFEGIAINVPEAQVYLLHHGQEVRTYPVAVSMGGDWKMPIANTHVIDMEKNPTWHIPERIQKEMKENGQVVKTQVDPGPRNPLGVRWIGFFDGSYGFHGTNMPSSIKHYASHGCVRFLKHDIVDLYGRVHVGTPVHVLYQPVLLAAGEHAIWLSVYPDIYQRDYDFRGAVAALAREAHVSSRLNWKVVDQAIRDADGIVVNADLTAPAPKNTHPSTPAPHKTTAPSALPNLPMSTPTPVPSEIAPAPHAPAATPTPVPSMSPITRTSAPPGPKS